MNFTNEQRAQLAHFERWLRTAHYSDYIDAALTSSERETLLAILNNATGGNARPDLFCARCLLNEVVKPIARMYYDDLEELRKEAVSAASGAKPRKVSSRSGRAVK